MVRTLRAGVRRPLAPFIVALVLAACGSDDTGPGKPRYAIGGTLAGLLAGLTDVDAITLTMANLVKSKALEPEVASRTIVIAVASNTVVKGIMAVVLGGWPFARRIVEVSAIALVLGLGLAIAL